MTVSPALTLYNLGLFISAIFTIVPVFLAFILFLYGVHLYNIITLQSHYVSSTWSLVTIYFYLILRLHTIIVCAACCHVTNLTITLTTVGIRHPFCRF